MAFAFSFLNGQLPAHEEAALDLASEFDKADVFEALDLASEFDKVGRGKFKNSQGLDHMDEAPGHPGHEDSEYEEVTADEEAEDGQGSMPDMFDGDLEADSKGTGFYVAFIDENGQEWPAGHGRKRARTRGGQAVRMQEDKGRLLESRQHVQDFG
eukprot:s736_g5.t1